VVIVAAVGQTILTTAGMLSGWITSIVSVSAPLMGPEDRMVDWVTGTRFLAKWVPGPSGAAISWRATLIYWLLGRPSPPIVFMINSKAVYRPSSPAATGGMPQDGKDETEMVRVQAGHKTAHILERRAKCEGLDECQKCGVLLRTRHLSTAL